MIGDYFEKTKQVSLWQLLTTCRKFDGFKDKNGERVGVFHQALVKTARENGFSGKIIKNVSPEKLIELLKKNYLVILSVDKNKIDEKLTGGHLMLVLDYLEEEKTFLVNDPDPLLAKNGQEVKLSKNELEKISNEKGIAFSESQRLMGKRQSILYFDF